MALSVAYVGLKLVHPDRTKYLRLEFVLEKQYLKEFTRLDLQECDKYEAELIKGRETS